MNLVNIALFLYFLLSVLYVWVFTLAAKCARPVVFPSADRYNKIALLVPAYKEDQVILSVTEHLLKQDYPKARYDVVIIADSLKKSTLLKLSEYPVVVYEVTFDKSTKAKSLNYALSQLDTSYDIAVISDADNIPESHFLTRINDAYQHGCSVVQGRRVAKNHNTPFALLDAANEIINNHIFRKGFNAMGLSSALIGSVWLFHTRS